MCWGDKGCVLVGAAGVGVGPVSGCGSVLVGAAGVGVGPVSGCGSVLVDGTCSESCDCIPILSRMSCFKLVLTSSLLMAW